MAAILAIEFAELECKVAVADLGKSMPVVRDLFRIELPKNEDQKLRIAERSRLLKEGLAARKIRTRHTRIIVPKNYVMARMVTLPSTSESEIAGMVRFEAERHIPFNAERHIVSHHILAKLGVEGSQVLLAAIDRPIAQEYVDICSGAGLIVDSIGVSSLSVFNAYAACAAQDLSGKVVALINLGPTYTDIVIVNDGVLSFTRGTSVSLQKLRSEYATAGRATENFDVTKLDVLDRRELLGEDETELHGETTASGTFVLDGDQDTASTESKKTPLANWLLQLLKEMRRTYEFARREFNCPPITEIQVTGEGALLRNVDQFFSVNFGVEAHVFSPKGAFSFSADLQRSIDNVGPVYAAVLGAIAPRTDKSVVVNLVPPEYIAQLEKKRRRQSYITTGVLAAVALILAYIWIWDAFARQSELLEIYKQKNREMKERVEDLQSKKKKLEIIRRYIQDKHGALDILERISSFEFIPERVTLTRFEYQKDETVKIEGHARTLPDINRFESELKKTQIFESVVQDQGSNKPIRLPNRTEPVLQFQMTCTFPKRQTKSPPPAKKESQTKATASEEDSGDDSN